MSNVEFPRLGESVVSGSGAEEPGLCENRFPPPSFSSGIL